jgi:nitrite reductase (NADH) small subunit
MTWIDAGPMESIPRCGARVLRVACASARAATAATGGGNAEHVERAETGEEAIAVFRTGDGRVFALGDRCPHRGGPLSQGIVHGASVTCPLHDWVIDLASGAACGPDEGKTPTYEVCLENGRVLIRVGR